MNKPTVDEEYRYEAFISYSHAADGELSPAIQRALSRFGKPWYGRSLPIWRDETGLGLTLDLWGEIQERLQQSKCFVLLASPEAAQSQWVEKEIRFWLQYRREDPLLIVLTGGDLVWLHDEMDFDWNKTTALPRSLAKVFQREPLWADFRWAKGGAELSLQSRRFFVEIAKLVAGMRGVPLERVYDEAELQHKRSKRLLVASVGALAILTLTAVLAALVSFQAKRTADRLDHEKQVELNKRESERSEKEAAKRREAEKQHREQVSREIAAKASAVLAEDRELSSLLALEAMKKAHTLQAENSLRQSLLQLVPPMVLLGHSGPVYSGRFSADGKQVLTSGADKTVRLWDAAYGTNLVTLNLTNHGLSGDTILGLLSSNAATILTVVIPETLGVGHWDNGSVEIYSAANGSLLFALPDHDAVVADLSPDGRQIVTGGFNTAVQVWDVLTGKLRLKLVGHEHRVASAAFSPNGKWILTGSWDGTARIWDSTTGKQLARLPASERVDAAAFNWDGSRVLTVSRSENKRQELRLWDWANAPGGSLILLTGHELPVRDFAFSRDGKWLATASNDKTARIWDIATGRAVRVLSKHQEYVNGVDFSPNGRWVVTAGGDSAAIIWDGATGEELTELGWNESPRTCVVFSPDGKRILTGTTEGEVAVYTYEICGSVDDLVALAHKRIKRELSSMEIQNYVQNLDRRGADK